MAETITGDFLGLNGNGVFLYRYSCPACGRRFTDTAPELSAPSICHLCLVGNGRGAAHCQPSGRRKARHRPKE